MRNIKVDKKELITILKDNMNKHVIEHKKALDGYHQEVIEGLTKALEQAKSGEKYIVNILLEKPITYEESYKMIIGMLELDTSEHIELDEREYKQYVVDEWSWTHTLKSVNSSYLGK
jgi:hypothetical protein